jgi:hypothetical protein
MTHDQQAILYIHTTGGNPSIGWFDDDFEPAGPLMRKSIVDAELAHETDEGTITLTEKGIIALKDLL